MQILFMLNIVKINLKSLKLKFSKFQNSLKYKYTREDAEKSDLCIIEPKGLK